MKKMEMRVEYCWLPKFREPAFNQMNRPSGLPGIDKILLFSQEGWELKAAVPIQKDGGRTLGVMHYFQRKEVPE